MVGYKNKAIVFGGVYDEEGPHHSLQSVFYNDMYAFDMERKYVLRTVGWLCMYDHSHVLCMYVYAIALFIGDGTN